MFFARQGYSLHDRRLFQLYAAVVVLFTTYVLYSLTRAQLSNQVIRLDVVTGMWRIYNICVLLRPWVRSYTSMANIAHIPNRPTSPFARLRFPAQLRHLHTLSSSSGLNWLS